MIKPVAVFVLFACFLNAAEYWPTKGWREATPESQGIDSTALTRIIDFVHEGKINLHSLLLIRHGYVVLDTYFYPYAPGVPHDAASVTKSITSTLVGIAADQHLLKTTDQVLALFPDERPSDAGQRKQRMTIDDLLTMRPGLDCGFLPGEQELGQMRAQPNWVRFALSLPMKYDPGTQYGYCSPGFHLLSSIVTATSHQSAQDFAKANLFEPLGIHNVIWPADPQGRTHGWGDSHLLPRDFAKIGYLFLHEGKWQDRQVVSAAWIKRATSVHSHIRANVDYGYGWWLYNHQTPPTFEANGRGGQRIIVAPEADMVVVMTGGGFNPAEISSMVFAAVNLSELPPNAPAERDLRAMSEAASQAPAPTPMPVPAQAAQLSGRVYKFDPNPARIESISLDFPKRRDAWLRFTMLGKDYSLPLALDGVYRVTPAGPYGLPAAAKGEWVSTSEFLLDLNLIANINHYTMRLRFEGERLRMTVDEASGLAKNLELSGK